MSVVRVVFLGTPDFACASLQGLIDDDHFNVVGVVSQPDRPAGRKMKLSASPVKKMALENDIPVITPENVNSPDSLAQIKAWGAEAAVVVAFGQLMSDEFLSLYPNKVVNVHASLLPRWRGAAPIQRSLMAGDEQTGVCLQVMVKKLDAGAVLGSRKLATQSLNAIELHDKLKQLGADLLHVEFMDYLRGNLTPVAQDEKAVTYAKKIEKSEARIDWQADAVAIHNKVRGLAMGPGAVTTRNDKKVKLHRTAIDPDSSGNPGEVVVVGPEFFTVACGQQALKIFEIQPESKPKMAVSEYLKGYPLKAGEVFQ